MPLAEPVRHPLPLLVDAVHRSPVNGRGTRAQRFVDAVAEADALHEREPVGELQPNFDPRAVRSGGVARSGAADRKIVDAGGPPPPPPPPPQGGGRRPPPPPLRGRGPPPGARGRRARP